MAKVYLITENTKNDRDETHELKFHFDEVGRLVVQSNINKITLSDKDTEDLRVFLNRDRDD